MKTNQHEHMTFYVWYFVKHTTTPKLNSFELRKLARLYAKYRDWCREHLLDFAGWEVVKSKYAKEEH